jgi:hypothetical protein
MRYGEVLLVLEARTMRFKGLDIVRYCSKMQSKMFEVDRGQSDCCIDLLSTMRKVLACLLSTTCDVDVSVGSYLFYTRI